MNAVKALIQWALDKKLIEDSDVIWAENSILDAVRSDDLPDVDAEEGSSLQDILDVLTEDAYRRGVIDGQSAAYRDLLDTEIMGRLTPRPADVIREFRTLLEDDPEKATDWFYDLCRDTNYIRADRIKNDIRWTTGSPYGEMELSINLSKPEKDPEAIAAAGKLKPSGYPMCQLCVENEGYAGRLDHPARQNLRVIPLELDGDTWYFQYSPYSYYSEHCIVLNGEHVPMKVSRKSIRKLLAFVKMFPHYFVGSNADLPIVGGSILSHDHFQGGRHTFPMEKAPVSEEIRFDGFDDVKAGIVKWPMSVIRITAADPERLADLADRIIASWRGYSDEAADICCETDGTPHNTATVIARRRNGDFELDIVLRNNLTTEKHPLGLFHPHEELHHIKKENIGLIEVMGLAILPGRLKKELGALAAALAEGADLRADPLTKGHADWAEGFREKYDFSSRDAMDIIKEETGRVFVKVLEDAGVFKCTEEGQKAFRRFTGSVE